MPILHIPALMKSYASGKTQILLEGKTIAEALTDLNTRYPLIKNHLVDKSGNLRRYVNLFINGTNIKDLDGVETPVLEHDVIILLPSISGG